MMPNMPWLAHMHGWLGKTSILRNQFVEGLSKRLQRRADVVLGGSAFTCSEVAHLGMKRMHVLPNGVNLPPLNAAPEERRRVRALLGIDDSAVVIGVTSRLHPGKGHRFLFEAFAQLQQKHPTARIIVVGDGDYRSTLEAIAKDTGIANAVKFAGRVPAVLPYLFAMDIFCLPSLKESLSMAVLEAMAAARCTVTTDVGDFRTLITPNENGQIVPPENAPALAAALDPLLSDATLRTRLAAAARTTIEHKFSVAGMVRSLEHFYDETLATCNDI
jgi:glycosyltransferase involved in cell wall biosynthesis